MRRGSHPKHVLAALCLVTLACGGGGEPPTTETDASTASTVSTATTTTAASAASSTGSTGSPPAECTCTGDTCASGPCPVVAGGCPDHCPTGFMVQEADLQCALEALRDGVPGVIAWSYTPNGGGTQESGSITVLAGRKALRAASVDMGVCGSNEDTVYGDLQGPDFYTACLAEMSPQNRFTCMQAGLLAVEIVCRAGSSSCGEGP